MSLQDLRSRFPREGRLSWIGLSAERRGEIRSVDEVRVDRKTGLAGDHHGGNGKRQVTLIQAEHLAVLESLLGRSVPPELVRRNLLVSGINLTALKGQRFRVGEVELEGTEPCHPCSRMEENLGPGGMNAMRGHGGLVAKVIAPGILRVGDTVTVLGTRK